MQLIKRENLRSAHTPQADSAGGSSGKKIGSCDMKRNVFKNNPAATISAKKKSQRLLPSASTVPVSQLTLLRSAEKSHTSKMEMMIESNKRIT